MTDRPTHSDAPPAADGRSIAEVTALAGGLAHELRNPLSTIKVNLQLLAEDLSREDADPADVNRRALARVGVVRREAERLQALFDEFLSLAGPCRLNRAEIDLRTVVDHLVAFLEPTLTAADIAVERHRPDAPVSCPLDEKLIEQALLNIVLNAADAMPDGGTLTIEIAHAPPWATVLVRDTGTGIGEEDRPRIFDPFFSTKPKGTGLGLAITRRVVREHGGEIDFNSTLGQGTTFTLRLPLDPTGG